MSITIREAKMRIDATVAALERVRTAADDILKKLGPVMKQIDNVDGDLVKQGVAKYRHSPKLMQSHMKEVCNEWLSTASTVKEEIDRFIVVNTNGDLYGLNHRECPFLMEVWNGDAYDVQGVEGLNLLRDELVKQFTDTNREALFAAANKLILND